jgi:hypothetical protein
MLTIFLCSGLAACWLLVFVLVLALLILCVVWWLYITRTPSSAFGYYSVAAVASDSRQCSDIGRQVKLVSLFQYCLLAIAIISTSSVGCKVCF